MTDSRAFYFKRLTFLLLLITAEGSPCMIVEMKIIYTVEIQMQLSSLRRVPLSDKLGKLFSEVIDMRSIADKTYSNTYNGAFLAVKHDGQAFSFLCQPDTDNNIIRYLEEFG